MNSVPDSTPLPELSSFLGFFESSRPDHFADLALLGRNHYYYT